MLNYIPDEVLIIVNIIINHLYQKAKMINLPIPKENGKKSSILLANNIRWERLHIRQTSH
jgi:hypothetical protein